MADPPAPPPLAIGPLLMGFMASRVLHVAMRLGLPDLIKDGPKTAAELAALTDTHAPSLARLLRALASTGVVEATGDAFRLAPGAESLCVDVPGSVVRRSVLFASDEIWEAWGQLEHSIRTGESGYRKAYGASPFEHRAAHPDLATKFNEAMADMTRMSVKTLMAAYDFSRFATLVDIGGGSGTLLATLLAAAPAQQGVVFDIASGFEQAAATLAAAGVAERCTIVEGDFFVSVPGGGDAYILKQILLDWDDTHVVALLKTVRNAMAESARLVVLEPLLPPAPVAAARMGFMLDLNMLAGPGGRWRTDPELRALLASAGFEVTSAVQSDLYVLEAKPV